MTESPAVNPARVNWSGRLWKLLALILVPVMGVVIASRVERACGPRWVTTGAEIQAGYDPDYVYLLHGLMLAEGAGPPAVHPGTTLQAASAGVLLARGGGGSGLRGEVLKDPESALDSISVVIRAFQAMAALMLGLSVWRVTGSVVVAAASQALTLSSLSAMGLLHRVMPEPMLLASSVVLSAVIVSSVRSERRLGWVAGAAVVVAFGVATKLTFLPMVVAAWGVVGGRIRAWAVHAGVGVLSLAVFLAPGAAEAARSARWFSALFFGEGKYGASSGGSVIDAAAYVRGFGEMILTEPLTLVAGIVGAAIGAAVRRRGSDAGRRAGVALLFVGAAQVLQFVIVAKHPGGRYLIPAVGLMGANVCLVALIARERWRGFGVAVMAGAAVALAITVARQERWNRTARERQGSRVAVAELADEAAAARGVVMMSYSSSSMVFGLMFADSYSKYRFSPELIRMFPNRGVFVSHGRVFALGDKVVDEGALRAPAERGLLFFQCPARMLPSGYEYEEVAADDSGGLYRARPKPR